jgi:glycosyltransferase involved in cell wall biosynthesis
MGDETRAERLEHTNSEETTSLSVSNTRLRSESISVVIPVYNSEKSLAELIGRLQPVLMAAAEQFEVILVDDGSTDRSWQEIENLIGAQSWVRGLSLMRNYGQHNAILAGIRQAHGGLIITMDDDLQNPPEEIPRLIEKLLEGFDVVYGKPKYQRHGLLRNAASTFTKLALSAVMGAETARQVSAFRVFRAEVSDAFANFDSPFVSIDALLTWGTVRFGSVRVSHEERPFGSSGYSFVKLLKHAVDMVTGFSTCPLQLASIIGFVLAFFGFGVLVFVLGRYFIEGGSVPGFAFLASAIAIFSGSQLFALGIIGEYLARIHFRVMGAPSSAIRERVGFQEKTFE